MRKFPVAVTFLALLAFSAALFARSPFNRQDDSEDQDKYVRLMSAQSVKLIEIDGKTYRKAEGPARFLHNDTWLVCDTALWSVDDQMVYASGHVSIEQENTELISDSLTYSIKENLARFRGGLVELRDKEGNTLRTMNLDYNTKDSVATFRHGAAMRDSKGQLIESIDGTYEAKAKLFTFRENVNMFTDSIFIRTSLLLYDSRTSQATYPEYVDAWKEDKMLSSRSGWYKREKELFFFDGDVHTMSEDKEGWCDSLFFNRKYKDVELLGNVQLVDTTRDVASLAGYIHYVDSTSSITLTRDPVVLMGTEEMQDGRTVKDTVFVRADTIRYWSVRKCDMDTTLIAISAERTKLLDIDPVANIRAKAAEELAKRIKEAEEEDPNRPPQPLAKGGTSAIAGKGVAMADTLAGADSLSRVDSLAMADSLAIQPKDTTKFGFLSAWHSVKVFKAGMQMVCDSLEYSDLDSLARLFKDPVVWNERTHQYSADSIYVLIKDEKMRKADLMSNAFIHIKEDDKHFDQIRASEMMAHFNDSTKLSRFDAMGSAIGLFFLKEKDRIATANRKESALLSANFNNGEISRITYYQEPKSNAYPVAQMGRDDLYLKGYGWKQDIRPKSSSDITDRRCRPSQRQSYAGRPRPEFRQTKRYFHGYIDQVYKALEHSDSLRRAAESRSLAEADTTVSGSDSLAKADTVTLVARSDLPADAAALAAGTAVGAAVTTGAVNAAAMTDIAAHSGAEALAADTDVAGAAAADTIASAVTGPIDTVVAKPAYLLVHPDDSLHRDGTPPFGHVLLLDSLQKHVPLDTLGMKLYLDTLGVALVQDSLGRKVNIDSLGWRLEIIPFTDKELKKQEALARKKAAQDKRDAALAAREARWKALDERDAAKQAAKEEKKRAKLRARDEAYIRKMADRKAKEDALLETYRQRYLEKLSKKSGL